MQPNMHRGFFPISNSYFRRLIDYYFDQASHEVGISQLKVEIVLRQLPWYALRREGLAEDLPELDSEALEDHLYKATTVREQVRLTHPRS